MKYIFLSGLSVWDSIISRTVDTTCVTAKPAPFGLLARVYEECFHVKNRPHLADVGNVLRSNDRFRVRSRRPGHLEQLNRSCEVLRDCANGKNILDGRRMHHAMDVRRRNNSG